MDNYLPIHGLTVGKVWETIRDSRAADLVHYAYGLGMPRVSCAHCIYAPKAALVLAARHNMDLAREYRRVEEATGHKFKADLSMAEVVRVAEKGDDIGPVTDWKM